MAFMDLPAVPPELKATTPYIQRANELFTTDPVMSYWCAYYAAQIGITLRAKATVSRAYLINLLDALERLKSQIGDNDAVHDESAASAYVENFALKVFAMADNEDRQGDASRGTAKKFLAAANFLEILRTFDKERPDTASPAPDSAEEKIRYAKWKAAEIAKAFREGRKPTPGPAGSEPEPAPAPPSPPVDAPSLSRTTPPPPTITDLPSPQKGAFFQQQPPPGHVPDELLAHTLPGASSSVRSPAWSTAATPGTPGRPLDAKSRNNLQARVSEETGLPPGFVPEQIDPDPSAPPMEDLPPGFVPSAPAEEVDGPSAPYAEVPPVPLSPHTPVLPSGPSVPAAPPPILPVAPPLAPVFPVAPVPVLDTTATAWTHYVSIASLGLALLLGLVRYFVIDRADPLHCDALLTEGQWLDDKFKNWQPEGCMMHTYGPKDISTCMRNRRVVFIGDSVTRQLFFQFAHTVDSTLPTTPSDDEHKHADYTYTAASSSVHLSFIWDPYLNSSHAQSYINLVPSGPSMPSLTD
ncbi:hypothetical protein EVJ58_g3422, partial [Rhodofomes roseus]